jgi:hypothetical protein
MAPTPYTAEQIRDATRPGRTYRYRIEVFGSAPILRQITFVDVTPRRARLRTEVLDESGALLSRSEQTTAWEELRRHAEFPQERVTIEQATATVPAGAFRCAVYTVRRSPDEVLRFYFATDLPGPPVLFTTEKAGTRMMTSSLLEHRAK